MNTMVSTPQVDMTSKTETSKTSKVAQGSSRV